MGEHAESKGGCEMCTESAARQVHTDVCSRHTVNAASFLYTNKYV